MPKWKLVIAEDHAILREGLVALLRMEPDLTVVGEACDGKEVVQVISKTSPDVVLIDLSMPHTNGTEAISKIKRRYPDVKIIVLTVHKAEEYIRAALADGASGYTLKDDNHQELIRAIYNVMAGKIHLSPSICDKVVNGYLGDAEQPPKTRYWDVLTVREREVMKLIAEGYRNKDIAHYLSISHKTVEKHRSNLMKKLNLHNTSALTSYAIENGLVHSAM